MQLGALSYGQGRIGNQVKILNGPATVTGVSSSNSYKCL